MTFWQTFISTFLLVLLAELGDKTHLTVMLLATQDKPLWGDSRASAALVAASYWQ